MEEASTRAGVGDSIGQAGTAIKDGLVGNLKAICDIETAMVRLVRQTVADTLRATDTTASTSLAVVSAVVHGTLQATDEVGTGLALSTKSLTKGVAMGVGDIGGNTFTLVRHAVKGMVAGAAKLGADVAVVAGWAIQGVIEATQETGGNVDEAITAAATGALEAASMRSRTAVRAVLEVLLGVPEDVQDLLGLLVRPAVQWFHLDDNLIDHGLWQWYTTAVVGDTAVVALPFYDCQEVRLIRQEHYYVHWWPSGEAGMTMPLEDAILRLQMLPKPRHM